MNLRSILCHTVLSTYKLTQNLHGAVSFSYHTIHIPQIPMYNLVQTENFFTFKPYYRTIPLLSNQQQPHLSACSSNVELKTKQRNLEGRLRLSAFSSSPITPPSPRHDGGRYISDRSARSEALSYSVSARQREKVVCLIISAVASSLVQRISRS